MRVRARQVGQLVGIVGIGRERGGQHPARLFEGRQEGLRRTLAYFQHKVAQQCPPAGPADDENP